MNVHYSVLDQVLQQLPAHWCEPVQVLAADTLQSDKALRLVLLGAFAVGKSSLINMLLQENLLPASLGETTALPTFIEQGPKRSMQLVGRDGSVLPLEHEEFVHYTTQAPQGAACAVVALPLPWLEGVSIIDLPGLGTNSVAHREYTLAHLRQGDAVLYLLGPCGPSQDDVEMLQLVRKAGKRVAVLVARWDVAQASVEQGERMPSLQQWAAQIERGAGLQASLTPCHRGGLGRDEVIRFICQAREDLEQIRVGRFKAELLPMLQNALGQNAQSRQSCEVSSEDEARARHLELMQRKQALHDVKAGLQLEQQADCVRFDQACEATVRSNRQALARQLDEALGRLDTEAHWPEFEQHGADALRVATRQVAHAFSGLSAGYGGLSLPEEQVQVLDLRLPEPQPVSVEDFLDAGKLMQLQRALQAQQAEQALVERKLAVLPETAVSIEDEVALSTLQRQRDALALQPLPMAMQRNDGNSGAAIGRVIGEFADLALMLANPAAVGVKVAAVLGRGAKVAKIAVNTAKVARTVKAGVKMAQAAQLGQTLPIAPPTIIDKLGGLEKLSLAYWGERIGTLVGGGPQDIDVVDPEALATQQSALQEIDTRTHELRARLAQARHLVEERQLTGWALEQNRQKQIQLQAELVQLQDAAERRHRDVEQEQRKEREVQLRRLAERALIHWLRSFDQQTAAMGELMHAHIRSYWEDRVDGMIAERLADIELFASQAQADAAQKRALLVQLGQEVQAIDRAIAVLA